MPGTSALVGHDPLSASRLLESQQELKYKDGYYARILLSSPNIAIGFSGYDGYPSYFSEDENLLILVEGLIYGASDYEIHSLLVRLSQNSRDRQDYEASITDFIERFDGDYLVLVYHKKEERMTFFNDRWGRLPVYFFQHDGLFALSRETKFLLHWMPSIEFDPFAIAEFLALGYTLGEKTVVKGIRRMRPASLIRIERSDSRVVVSEKALLPVNFDALDLGLTRQQILHECVARYNRALSARVKKLQEKGYTIVADLSGGFDTRVVFVSLCNTGANFTAINDIYVDDDQSLVTRELANLFGRKLLHCSAQHPVDDLSAMRRVTYLDDGMTHCRVALETFLTDAEREKYFTGPVARFMGLGVSWMRDPYRLKKPYRNLATLLADGAYSGLHCIPPAYACAMAKLKLDEFRNSLDCELRRFPEKDDEGRIKHLYFEYYNRSGSAGESRHRIFTWTVQPLWAKDFLSFEARNVPKNLVGYRFFIDFLRLLDYRALQVPVHGGHVRLDSPLSPLFYDAKMNLKRMLQYNVYTFKTYVWLRAVLRRYKKRDSKYERLVGDAREICRMAVARLDCIDEGPMNRFLQSSPSPMQIYQLLSLLFYLEEIEQRFGHKAARNLLHQA